MNRFVTVEFPKNGALCREDYGPFENSQHLVEWLDKHEETFGVYAVLQIRYLSVPEPRASPARKNTRTKKKAAASAR
jgi:hypothetical protein